MGNDLENTFCDVFNIEEKTELEKAIGVCWYLIRSTGNQTAKIGEIVEFFPRHHMSRPNVSRLRKKLSANKDTIFEKKTDSLTLKRSTLAGFDIKYRELVFKTGPASPQQIHTLEKSLDKISDEQVRAFILEAIGCLKMKYYRAAVIMSWQGAMSILEHKVFKDDLTKFNSEAISRSLIKKPISKLEDFQRIKEADKLTVMEAAGAISNARKKALVECLNRRNNCGHPNDYKISEHQSAAHLESLIDNVFSQFL